MAFMKTLDWKLIVAALSAIVVVAGLSSVAASAEKRTLRDARLEDIETVRTQYLPREMAYSPATRALAEAQLDRLEQDAGNLSEPEFKVGLAIVGALTDNAHSGLRLRDPAARAFARLPLRLLWMPDALIVARATGPAADLAGARVLKVEGRAPEALLETSKILLGGNDAGRKHWLNEWIESAGILHALGLAKSPDRITMKLRLPNGKTVSRTVAMIPVSELSPSAETARLWSPEPVPSEEHWATALGSDELPLYLRDANAPFRWVALEELDALYIQFRWNDDDDSFSIAEFLDEVKTEIAERRPASLIVDHRFNTGGNILKTLDFMRGLPDTVDGHSYLLVGPYTFSAGMVSAAAFKKHGGDRVTVVGDGLGDRLHFWSEGAMIELPNSRYSFRYTNGQFNLGHGCTGEPACMDDLYPIDVNGADLVPEIRTPLTAADYFSGRDPAMNAVVKRILATRGTERAREGMQE